MSHKGGGPKIVKVLFKWLFKPTDFYFSSEKNNNVLHQVARLCLSSIQRSDMKKIVCLLRSKSGNEKKPIGIMRLTRGSKARLQIQRKDFSLFPYKATTLKMIHSRTQSMKTNHFLLCQEQFAFKLAGLVSDNKWNSIPVNLCIQEGFDHW